MTLGAARRFFTRSSRTVSPVAFALTFTLLALESLVAPVIQWFAADTPMGDLRPALGTRLANRSVRTGSR
jgi:hypothetical protein